MCICFWINLYIWRNPKGLPNQNENVDNSKYIFTYTGDNRPPKQVFVEGFTPKKNIKILYDNTPENYKSEGYYVKTFLTPDMASKQGKYVYVIRNRNGIDLKKRLESSSLGFNKLEIAISGRILPGDVRGVKSKHFSLENRNYIP